MYEVQFPEYLAGYEHETEAKGYLVGVVVALPSVAYDLTVYDTERLGQDVPEEVESSGFFAAANLVVVPRVTRDEVMRAVERLWRANFDSLVPRRNL